MGTYFITAFDCSIMGRHLGKDCGKEEYHVPEREKGAEMTGWILFTGLAGLLAGIAIGVYLSAVSMAKMIVRGELIRTEKWEQK